MDRLLEAISAILCNVITKAAVGHTMCITDRCKAVKNAGPLFGQCV